MLCLFTQDNRVTGKGHTFVCMAGRRNSSTSPAVLRVVKQVLAVVREGNITRAAESLRIAQLSLSKQLRDLEVELGTRLLIRGKRGCR